VKLSYAHGWRVPGGGKKSGETPEQAILRELREEIGMQRHCGIKELSGPHLHSSDRASGNLFIVRDVEYSPRRSLEIEAVREFYLCKLPEDISPRVRPWIHASESWLQSTAADEASVRAREC